jgi:integrase
MASIYRREGTKIYQCQFYVTDPSTKKIEKIRQSTGATNKKIAQAYADEQERLYKKAIEAGSDKSAEVKRILADACAEVDRETFTALTARKYLSKLLAITTGEEMKFYTIETWSAEWLRRKSRNSSKATVARYTGHRKSFLDWLGERKTKPLESITIMDAQNWREQLQDEGRAVKTVLSYTKDMGAIFRSAIREGLVESNPFAALETLEAHDSQERKPFTPDEVSLLLDAAPSDDWRGLILVAAYTGLRLGDAAKLSWESVDLHGRTITVTPSKTKRKKKQVVIPIQPDLLAFLLAAPLPDDTPNAFVFPSLGTLRIGDRTGLSQGFNKIMAKAGVSRGKPSRVIPEGEKRGAGRITWERGFHSLRHTFTTWLRTAGVSEEDRMTLTGHSTRDSHAIYSHADEQASRDAIAKLPSLKNPKK